MRSHSKSRVKAILPQWALLLVCVWQVLMFALIYLPSVSARSQQWKVLGDYKEGTQFGVKEDTHVYDPDVIDGHVVESCGVILNASNWAEVGWAEQKYAPVGRWFFVAWVKNGVYYEPQDLYETATPGTDAEDWIKIQAFGTDVWNFYYKNKYITSVKFDGLQWSDYARSQSESTNTVNGINGYHWDLEWGGAYMSYFVWYDWSNTQWHADSPYYFIGHDDTWFKSGGPQ